MARIERGRGGRGGGAARKCEALGCPWEVIVVQAKAKRLGLYLMGQTLFSAELIKRFNPASVKSVALCSKGDSELEPLLAPYPHVEVVVMPEKESKDAERPAAHV